MGKYWQLLFYFYVPRLITLRGGDRNEETPTTENERGVLMRRACARALSPRSFSLLENSFQLTPSPHCGLASWPLLGACSMYPKAKSSRELLPKYIEQDAKKAIKPVRRAAGSGLQACSSSKELRGLGVRAQVRV